MAANVTQQQALVQLGASTAQAVARVLDTFVSDGVDHADVSVIGDGQNPFPNLPVGGIAASVRYSDGVTGANVFVMSAACARALASAMGVEPSEGMLSELEMSAIGEAANQMLAAAATATSVVIGNEIAVSPPDVTILDARVDAADIWGTAPYACSTSFTILGESCRLVQLVPNAFVVRMARAIDERSMEQQAGGELGRTGSASSSDEAPITDKLGAVTLRVWAELGRTELPLGSALELPAGAVVDLDRTADAPIDLFANGLCFGQGQLLVTDDGEWAVEITALTKPSVRKLSLAGGTGVTTA